MAINEKTLTLKQRKRIFARRDNKPSKLTHHIGTAAPITTYGRSRKEVRNQEIKDIREKIERSFVSKNISKEVTQEEDHGFDNFDNYGHI